MTDIILKSELKTIEVLSGYSRVGVSISGGADSDIVIDIIERCKMHYPNTDIKYIFYDTGLEYSATKKHLDYLESRYNITIERFKAYKPIPLAVKQFGQPFLSKRISNYINRLQDHGFTFENKPFGVLYKEYPNCKAALRWFCNDFGYKSHYNIEYTKGLREYLIEFKPTFQISDKCCLYAKKKTSKIALKELNTQLDVVGLRKYEGGARNILKSCYDITNDRFFPILWYHNHDKIEYNKQYNIINSDCYTKYGLCRTGCVGCPFGQDYNDELNIVKLYEPKLYSAVKNIFGKSYEYTDNFKLFRK